MLANEVYLQYALCRERIDGVLSALAEAHDEDLALNADMFDTASESFSCKMHPNARLRALEAELAGEDEEYLLFLTALTEAGMELSLGLATAGDVRTFCALVAAICDEQAAKKLSVPVLAHRLTEPKAGLLFSRLSLAVRMLTGE